MISEDCHKLQVIQNSLNRLLTGARMGMRTTIKAPQYNLLESARKQSWSITTNKFVGKKNCGLEKMLVKKVQIKKMFFHRKFGPIQTDIGSKKC